MHDLFWWEGQGEVLGSHQEYLEGVITPSSGLAGGWGGRVPQREWRVGVILVEDVVGGLLPCNYRPALYRSSGGNQKH